MPGFFASRRPVFWIWFVVTLLLTGGAAAMLGLLLTSGDRLTYDAYEAGQRFVVSLADNSVNGRPIQEGEQAEHLPDALPAEESTGEAHPEPVPDTPDDAHHDSEGEASPTPVEEAPEDDGHSGASQQPPHAPHAENHEGGGDAPETFHDQEKPAADHAVASEEEMHAATPDVAPLEDDRSLDVPSPLVDDAPLIDPAEILAEDILPRAPGKGLTERTPAGELPVVSEDGTQPWRFYARTQSWSKDKPWVAVVVTGLGLGKYTTEGAISLHPDFTLSFSPYARDIAMWLPNARSRGHEAMLDLPVETQGNLAADPGPHALLAHAGAVENLEALHWVLSRVQGFTGVITPADGALGDAKEAIAPIIEELGKRGLAYAHGNSATFGMVSDMGKSHDVPVVAADIVIDGEITPAAIRAQLAALEKLASDRGYAVGIAQRYPITIKTLEAWEKELKGKSISLVPLSAIANDQL